jgi:hypothetical protein
MDPLLDTLVLLSVLSGLYLILGLGCDLAERLIGLSALRPRRARTQTGRTQRRTRTPRPRRRREGPNEGASAAASMIGAAS